MSIVNFLFLIVAYSAGHYNWERSPRTAAVGVTANKEERPVVYSQGVNAAMASVIATAVAPSDEVLLAHAVRKDPEALEELFRRYRLVAYRVAYRLLSNEADALDAVQEGFVKALTHLPGFQGRSSFKTWLLRVVSNAALDLGRQRGRRETLPLDGLASAEREALEPVSFEDPASRLERNDLRRHLQGALGQLPEAQRRTFVLHVEGGLSYREVADVLKISIGTVMSRLYYARQKLKGFLNGWMTEQ